MEVCCYVENKSWKTTLGIVLSYKTYIYIWKKKLTIALNHVVILFKTDDSELENHWRMGLDLVQFIVSPQVI